MPGPQRGLRELDGADVVLGDRETGGAVVEEDVGEGAAVGDHVGRAGRGLAAGSCRRRRSRPARKSSASALTIPEPHTPVTAGATVANPGSSLHRSAPMTRTDGTSVVRSIRTRSIAPAVARWPQLICAPSKAGPVGLDAANTGVAVAEHDLGVRADVDEQLGRPTQRYGPSLSIAAAVSAPTWPAMHGSRCAAAFGSPRPSASARVSTGSSVASSNGAVPSGVGSSPSTR